MQTTIPEESITDLARLSAPELVTRCVEHDCAASWEEFLHRYGRVLAAAVGRAMRRVGRVLAGDRDDLLQEVYCHLLADDRRRLRRCRATDERSLVGYLCRVAENVVLDQLRRADAAKRGRRLMVAPAARQGGSLVERAADPGAAADRRLRVAEGRRLLLDRAAEVLRGRNRRRDLRVLYLAVFEDWTSREIATGLGAVTANNVDSIVHRTKRKLAGAGVDLSTLAARR